MGDWLTKTPRKIGRSQTICQEERSQQRKQLGWDELGAFGELKGLCTWSSEGQEVNGEAGRRHIISFVNQGSALDFILTAVGNYEGI